VEENELGRACKCMRRKEYIGFGGKSRRKETTRKA
jgi:hypothetical protein